MEADREEQEMEVEALQSILDEKFTVLGDSARVARSAGGEGEGLQWYQIELRPFEDEEDEDEQPVEVVLLLRFAHPDWYPSTRGPLLSLASAGGLADEDVRSVQELLEQSVEEHLGMVMVFNFLEIAKEEARRRIRARSASSATASGAENAAKKQDKLASEQGAESSYQASLRAAAAESERLKEMRRIGTLVTADVFVSWRRQYDEDMRCAREERLKQTAAVIMAKGANTNDTTLSGMTGKEFFQSGKHLGSRSGKAANIQRDAGGETREFTEDGGDDEWSDYEDDSDDEEDILEALAAAHSGGGVDAGEDEAVLDS